MDVDLVICCRKTPQSAFHQGNDDDLVTIIKAIRLSHITDEVIWEGEEGDEDGEGEF